MKNYKLFMMIVIIGIGLLFSYILVSYNSELELVYGDYDELQENWFTKRVINITTCDGLQKLSMTNLKYLNQEDLRYKIEKEKAERGCNEIQW